MTVPPSAALCNVTVSQDVLDADVVLHLVLKTVQNRTHQVNLNIVKRKHSASALSLTLANGSELANRHAILRSLSGVALHGSMDLKFGWMGGSSSDNQYTTATIAHWMKIAADISTSTHTDLEKVKKIVESCDKVLIHSSFLVPFTSTCTLADLDLAVALVACRSAYQYEIPVSVARWMHQVGCTVHALAKEAEVKLDYEFPPPLPRPCLPIFFDGTEDVDTTLAQLQHRGEQSPIGKPHGMEKSVKKMKTNFENELHKTVAPATATKGTIKDGPSTYGKGTSTDKRPTIGKSHDQGGKEKSVKKIKANFKKEKQKAVAPATAGKGTIKDGLSTCGKSSSTDKRIGQESVHQVRNNLNDDMMQNPLDLPILGQSRFFDLAQTCKEAQLVRRWVLVAIYSNGCTDESSLALRQVIKCNEFIIDTIKGGFLPWEGYVAWADSFVVEYRVTKVPFVAIIEPNSMTVRWSSSHWELSESLIAENLAEACLRFGSYDPYEGLSTEKITNCPTGCEPPTHLVFTAGGFRAALQEAAASDRWMLVNLQSDDSLSSHYLNRDVWRDETIESIVKVNFIFWQKLEVSDEGRVYAKVFNVKAFPHVSILDPFNGRIVWRKDGWLPESSLTPSAFTEAFLSLPSLDALKKPQSSVMETQSDDRSSLSSLFESWEKLSVGEFKNEDQLNIESEVSYIGATAEQTSIPTEIFTEVMKDS